MGRIRREAGRFGVAALMCGCGLSGASVSKGIINLWVAGRCDSSDSKVHGSIRAQSAADMMAQAAAAGAVQSIR